MKRRRDFKRRIHKQPKSKFNLFAVFKKIDIFKYLSIFLIILFIFSFPAVIKRLIKIDKIECNTQFGRCSDQIISNFQLSIPNQLSFSKYQIQKKLQEDLQVSSYLIQYKIPSTIKIDLNLKKPKYSIKDLSGKYYLVDREGTVLEISDNSELLNLTNNSSYQVGQKISDKDKFALYLLEKIKIVNSLYSSEIKNDYLEVGIENGILVKFPLDGDIDVLVGSLRLIFSRLNEGNQGIRMEDISEIDLRFKNPILR